MDNLHHKSVASYGSTIEKQRQFLESILVKRKIAATAQHFAVFEELREKARTSHQANIARADPSSKGIILGKRTYTELQATMSVDELKSHLEERRSESRRRLQKMRQICGNIRTMVKESRGMQDIQQIRDEI